MKFKLRSLFVSVMVFAVVFAGYSYYARTQKVRQAKLQLFEKIRSPKVWGTPASAYPEIPFLADMTLDESHPDATVHMTELIGNRDIVATILNNPSPPQTSLKLYIFKIQGPPREGEPEEFAVFTHEGVVIFVSNSSPEW